MVVAEFGSGQVLLGLMWMFFFIVSFWLIIAVFADILRSHDLSGWGKAGWSFLVILLPIVGCLIYMIARGHKMGEHAVQDAQQQDAYFQSRVQSAVAATNGAAQIDTLTSMRQQGVIDDNEYQRMKAKVVSS